MVVYSAGAGVVSITGLGKSVPWFDFAHHGAGQPLRGDSGRCVLRKWIVTFFGSGLSPVAPGTMGSLLASVLLMGIFVIVGSPGFFNWQAVLLTGLVLSSVLSIALGPWAIGFFGREDPQPFVLDEVAGICLTNLFLPITVGFGQVWIIALAFAAFRLFDVTKPPPARQLEHLPAGWGILLDDLAAAVYANVLCQVLLHSLLRRLM
jgi:phosphatidylglycerophosphatase A